MATTSPDNLVFPGGSDSLNPLRSWFAQLASSTQAALTAIRSEAIKPTVPNPITARGAATQAITATAWADLPGISAVTLTIPAAMWVSIDVGAWVAATQGDTRISATVSGATALNETQLEVGDAGGAWGQVMYAGASADVRQQTSHRIVRLNAGTNTIKVRAYRSGAGVNQSNYTTLQVTPLRWA